MALLNNFIALFTESAPYLLLGMLIAGVLHEMIPSQWLQRLLGGKNAIVKAALIGAPLPLCSCSVIPVAMGIRRSGASKASTASFMISTPETGVDSIGITYALMGPVMAIVRPIVAIITAITAGYSIAWLSKNDQPIAERKPESEIKSCCNKAAEALENTRWTTKFGNAVRYGYGALLKDFMQWLMVGLVFAALVKTFVPSSFLSQFGDSIWAMLLVVLLSIPMYICATASTPIAVGLLMSGISPGAALVFMLTGPATNIATLMVVKQELGKQALFSYLITVIGVALVSGLLLNDLFERFNWQMDLQMGGHGEMQSLFYQACALMLAALMLWQWFKAFKARTGADKACHN